MCKFRPAYGRISIWTQNVEVDNGMVWDSLQPRDLNDLSRQNKVVVVVYYCEGEDPATAMLKIP